MLGHSFYPKITLPTGLNRTSGATLIDNIYCKLSSQTLTTSAGIILGELSDHYPYFLGIDNLNIKQTKPPRRVKQKVNNTRAMENLRDDMLDSNITKNLNRDLLADPHENYYILHCHLKSLKDKHMLEKYVKFNKHRHKKTNWISYGILRSFKFRDNSYMKYKQCAPNSIEYNTHKHNLGVLNGILKRIIREAKILHFEKLFHKYRSDMKMTCKTISEVVCKSNSKRLELEKIIVDTKTITNKIEICNEFNKFFTNIGPKLAGKINTENKECHQIYFKKRILTSFAFGLVDGSIVTKHIAMLRTKNSYGHDGISMKLLKFLLPSVIKPLTIVINQSLATGIFPEKLKIAKVMPFYKKDDITLMDNYRPVSLLTSISKVFEKVVFTQLYEYFDKQNLFSSSQYGFRKNTPQKWQV